MNTPEEIKLVVKNKYAEIAKGSVSSCCTTDIKDYTVFKDDASNLSGYIADADLGLGCGLPTEFAGIKQGDSVVDLGSGAGNDVFIARAIVGDKGIVTGIDMTEEMIEKANLNNKKLGYTNIEFRLGDIEDIPLKNEYADVVVSNCVLNLVPDKRKAFSEIFRILKPGGHFCVSDVVLHGEMIDELKKSAELYAGCVSGALQQTEYLQIIGDAGFKGIEIKKTKKIELPDELLTKYLSAQELKEYKDMYYNNNSSRSLNGESLKGIFSITVVAYKG